MKGAWREEWERVIKLIQFVHSLQTSRLVCVRLGTLKKDSESTTPSLPHEERETGDREEGVTDPPRGERLAGIGRCVQTRRSSDVVSTWDGPGRFCLALGMVCQHGLCPWA